MNLGCCGKARLGLNNLVADRKADEIRKRFQAELAHCGGAVRLNRFYAEIQNSGYLLVTLALGKKLDNLSFPRCEPIAWSGRGLRLAGLEKAPKDDFGDPA